jgi:hypothetical protein
MFEALKFRTLGVTGLFLVLSLDTTSDLANEGSDLTINHHLFKKYVV